MVTLPGERWLALTQTCCVRTARLHGGSELVFRIPTPGRSFATDEQSSWSAHWISRQAPPHFTRSVGTKSVACSRADPLMSQRGPLGGSVSPVSAVIRRGLTSWYRAPDCEPGRGGVDHAQPRWWSRRPHSGCLSPPGWYAPGRPAREVSPPTTTPPFWVWNRDGGATLAGREPSVPHVLGGLGSQPLGMTQDAKRPARLKATWTLSGSATDESHLCLSPKVTACRTIDLPWL